MWGFVVICGFEETVNGPEDLSPETMVALDCFDGKLDTLSNCGEQEGGRKLYSNGDLQVVGANKENFLDEQVNGPKGEKWLNTKTAYGFTTILNKDERINPDYTRKKG